MVGACQQQRCPSGGHSQASGRQRKSVNIYHYTPYGPYQLPSHTRYKLTSTLSSVYLWMRRIQLRCGSKARRHSLANITEIKSVEDSLIQLGIHSMISHVLTNIQNVIKSAGWETACLPGARRTKNENGKALQSLTGPQRQKAKSHIMQ